MIFRTDLALERREVYKKAQAIEDEIEGIEWINILERKNQF